MTKNALLSAIAAGLLAFLCCVTASAQSNFSSFGFPGATNTQATGITPSGNIVGRYTSADRSLHASNLGGAWMLSVFPDLQTKRIRAPRQGWCCVDG